MSRTTRVLGLGGGAALALTGLLGPAATVASAADAPALVVTPAAPAAGAPFSVVVTGITSTRRYELRLTAAGDGAHADVAEATDCATSGSGDAFTATCSLTEATQGAYDLVLLQGDQVVADQAVTVQPPVRIPAIPQAALPKVSDKPGTADDGVTFTKIDDVTWKVGGTPVTFGGQSTTTTTPRPAGLTKDYTIVADTRPGTTFPDGSVSWTKTYRFTDGRMVPAALPTPAAPVRHDLAGTADDGVTATKNANYSWSVDGVPVTFAPGENERTVKVTPKDGRNGHVTVTATAGDDLFFAGNAATYDVDLAFTDGKGEPTDTRVWGADRIATAVAVSQRFFVAHTKEVYVAGARTFADALAAGPAAARAGAPLLLTDPAKLDAGVAAEIARLQPTSITVVGGPGVVSPAVAAGLAKIAPVARAQGADRYATAAAVAARWDAAPTVYLASGRDFPDGISAGAAAARDGSPLLLTDGAGLSRDAAGALARLKPGRVVLVGGPAVIGASVEARVKELLPAAATVRYAGADRYGTSAALLAASAGGASAATTVLLASGENFPDALTAVPAAAMAGAPLALVPRTCVPAGTKAVLDTLPLTDVVRLGGPAVLGDAPLDAAC